MTIASEQHTGGLSWQFVEDADGIRFSVAYNGGDLEGAIVRAKRKLRKQVPGARYLFCDPFIGSTIFMCGLKQRCCKSLTFNLKRIR